MQGNKFSPPLLSQSDSARGWELPRPYRSVIHLVYTLNNISLEGVAARIIIIGENRVSEVDNPAVFHKGGIICRLGPVGRVLVSREVLSRAAEIGLVYPGEDLPLRLDSVR